MIRSEELAKGVLAKVSEDEPIFVIRGRDALAPIMIQRYIEEARYFDLPDIDKLEIELNELQLKVLKWQATNGYKMPDR